MASATSPARTTQSGPPISARMRRLRSSSSMAPPAVRTLSLRFSHLPRLAELGQRLLEDDLTGLRVAPVPHVGQVGLARDDAARRRRVGLVAPGRKAAARALPGRLDVGGGREPTRGPVMVGAPEGDALLGFGDASQRFPSWSGSC